MTKALRDVHSMGYIHGDIKPNNIVTSFRVSKDKQLLERMPTLEKNIYLIDFGLAKKIAYDENGAMITK